MPMSKFPHIEACDAAFHKAKRQAQKAVVPEDDEMSRCSGQVVEDGEEESAFVGPLPQQVSKQQPRNEVQGIGARVVSDK